MSIDNQGPSDPPGANPLGASNPFSDNPCAAPPPVAGRAPGGGMVRHVPVVAILMMVQGGFELLMGLGLVAFAGFFPALMKMDQSGGRPAEPPPEVVGWVVLAIYGGLGLLAVTAAALRIFAGARNYRYRSRTLGLVALGGGMATVFTCYCAPTSIALGVYGLITYLNTEVSQAFAMGEAGKNRSEILATFR